MEKAIQIYHSLFPHIGIADWFYCVLGLALHCWLKVKHISLKNFKPDIFFNDFAPVWIYSAVCIIICMGTLPYYIGSYTHLDSALIGYTSGSFFKQVLSQRAQALGLNIEQPNPPGQQTNQNK